MKKRLNYITIAVLFFLTTNGYAQKTNQVTGTIGNEKPGNDKIVICVFGTKACMPVKIDTTMTARYQGKDTKLTNLPFGLYLEATIAEDKAGGKIIKKINVDETKTVICFTELKKKQENKLNDVLSKTKGVNNFNIHPESSQVYIEYNPKTISYNELENTIKKAGYELE
jgi:Heavy-metal-associated domain.